MIRKKRLEEVSDIFYQSCKRERERILPSIDEMNKTVKKIRVKLPKKDKEADELNTAYMDQISVIALDINNFFDFCVQFLQELKK